MEPKLISVVIPACNEQKDIVACLRSLKNQTYKGPLEIIVVDNRSTDDTAILAKQEGATVVFEPNAGVCFARQKGTELAKGDIIVSTDGDTTFLPDWLENIKKAFSENPDVVGIGGPFILDNPPWWGNLIFTGLIFGIVKTVYKFTGRAFLFGSNTAFKKSAWSGYDTSLQQGGDEVFLLRQLRRKGRIIFLVDNPVITSSRRLEKGFLHFFIFYAVDYFYSLITHKSLIPARSVRMSQEKLKEEVK